MTRPEEHASRNVAILIFDDVEVLDFCGPFEVFSVAGQLSDLATLNVFTVAENSVVKTRNGLSVNPDFSLTNCPSPHILLVPGGQGTRREQQNDRLIAWIRKTGATAELVLSVCTGALLLGRAGFLNDLDVTTHHSAFDLLQETVPSATVVEDQRFVDNGRIVTAAGIAAGIDMSLHVVERLLGIDAAKDTAQYMEYPWNTSDGQ